MLPRRRLLIHLGMAVALVLIVTAGVFGAVRLIPSSVESGPRTDGSQSGLTTGSPPGPGGPTSADTEPERRERRTVRVGGATTDNLFPQDGHEVAAPHGCIILQNARYDVPVLVWDIRVKPGNEPATFGLGDPSRCQEHPPCLGRELPSQLDPEAPTCSVAIAVLREPGLETRLLLGLRTACRNTDREPCSWEEIDPPPTDADPATVEWTVFQRLLPAESASPSPPASPAPPTTAPASPDPATTRPSPTSPDGGGDGTAPADPGTGDG